VSGGLLVDASAPGAVEDAAAHLQGGGVVALPTDTVYGLAVLPSLPGAVDRLREMKDRPPDLPVAILVSRVAQARALVHFDEDAQLLADWFWPGALTIVLPALDGVDLDVGSEDGSVGVRLPDHAIPRALAARCGPLAVTSANRHGLPTPDTAAEVAAQLGNRSDLFVLDGGPCGARASTVVRLENAEIDVLRHGALSADRLRVALQTRFAR
jgi:L-threonylcarbamoyladenylate synthase